MKKWVKAVAQLLMLAPMHQMIAAEWGDGECDAPGIIGKEYVTESANNHDSDETEEGTCKCWACLNCTFRNSPEKRRCGACNTFRPAHYYITSN